MRPSGELACANKLYVVVFVTGVMISPSVVRVATLVPDPIQQIKQTFRLTRHATVPA